MLTKRRFSLKVNIIDEEYIDLRKSAKMTSEGNDVVEHSYEVELK